MDGQNSLHRVSGRPETNLAHAVHALDVASPQLPEEWLGKHAFPGPKLDSNSWRGGDSVSSQFDRIEGSLAISGVRTNVQPPPGRAVHVLFSGSFEGVDFGGEVPRCALDIGARGLLGRDAPTERFDLPTQVSAAMDTRTLLVSGPCRCRFSPASTQFAPSW